MQKKGNRKLSRRGFLALGAVAGSAFAAAAGWQRWRTIGSLRHVPGRANTGSLDNDTRTTVAHFLGVHFGALLADEDLQDLSGRLDFAVAYDSGWLGEYQWLAQYVDRLAVAAGEASFVAASPQVRDAVMREAAGTDMPGRRQRLQAFFSVDGRHLLRMRRSTLPQLHHLYRNSGVPWRQRGYVSWPGRPDDRLAYTRPLEHYRC